MYDAGVAFNLGLLVRMGAASAEVAERARGGQPRKASALLRLYSVLSRPAYSSRS